MLLFLRLIRAVNLSVIALSLSLFYYLILVPAHKHKLFTTLLPFTNTEFVLFIIAVLCIAAAGNIINDYFDINIDQVNKPNRVVVGSHINRRWVIFWHLFFSIMGIYVSTIAFPFKQYWHIHLSNLLTIFLLWFYSTNFKKDFLVGNVVIAILTAWSIAVVYFSKFTFQQIMHPNINDVANFKFAKFS
jgi:4-hydroxybenzoate polyprenyltransferase